jgi:hypothetical protein
MQTSFPYQVHINSCGKNGIYKKNEKHLMRTHIFYQNDRIQQSNKQSQIISPHFVLKLFLEKYTIHSFQTFISIYQWFFWMIEKIKII